MVLRPLRFGGIDPSVLSTSHHAADSVDQRTDIYSLGAVGYFLLTGQPPFVRNQAMELMIAHARDPVSPPRSLRPDIPPDLEGVIMRCLAKNVDERFASVAELDAALEACEARDSAAN